MNDIVARLRQEAQWLRGEDNAIPKEVTLTVESAADEIERLRAENERLREALHRIADGARLVDLTYAELFAEVRQEARAALAEQEEK